MTYRIDGDSFDTKDEYLLRIVEILRLKPMTPSQLAIRLNLKSREYVQRELLKPLLEKNLVEKIEGSHKYGARQKIGGKNPKSITGKVSENEIWKCESIQNWKNHAKTTKKGMGILNRFVRMCLGKNPKLPNFKMNPDSWNHPSTTIMVVNLMEKAWNIQDGDALNSGQRSVVRHFLKYGLDLYISKEDAIKYRISGKKDNVGAHSTASITDNQYELAKKYCLENSVIKTASIYEKHSYPSLLLFGVHYWTFVRPSVLFTIRLDQLRFFDRTIEYIESKSGNRKTIAVTDFNGKIIPDQAFYDIVIEKNIPIKIRNERACYFKDVYEYKTKKAWPKFCYDEDIVKPLEKYVESRMHRGKKYLFFEDNKKTFDKKGTEDFRKYDSKVRYDRKAYGNFVKPMYKKIGCTDEIFFEDPTYAGRHIGVQMWCILTNWNLELIANMGWDDMETLRLFYARRGEMQMMKSLAQVMK